MKVMYLWIVGQVHSYHMVHLMSLVVSQHVLVIDMLMCVLLLMKHSTLLIEPVTQ